MERTFRCLLALGLFAVAVTAPASASSSADVVAEPTFYGDVLPILQNNCQTCHRPGGANLGGMVAPMALTTYEEARPWAKSIAKQVEARTMPPWHAAPQHHGAFVNERTLETDEVETIVRWANTGATSGDPAKAPPKREWPANDGWTIGQPDLVIDMGQEYFVADEVEDQYVTFVTEITKEMLPEPRWIKAIEFRPGSPVVHHIIAFPLGGIAPGNDPDVYTEGTGRLLEPGTKVRWQMHYHKEPGAGTGVKDFSTAALRFYPAGYQPDYQLVTEPLTRFDFEIPAGAPDYSSKVSMKFERDSLILGYTPHMHVRGKAAHYLATYPDGKQEVLLEVPRYDFNRQTHYQYPAPGKRVPAGTEIELTMTWDNSANNPSNPDPTETVVFGEPTTAEMMFGFVSYADAEPGYRQPAGTGFLDNNRRIDPERMKVLLKERFGLDWDTMTPEQREEVLERFRARREGQAPPPPSSGR